MREHEKKYIDAEILLVEQETLSYFRSGWNYYDWVAYFLLLLTIILHLAPVSMYELNRANTEPLSENEVGEELPGFFRPFFVFYWKFRIFFGNCSLYFCLHTFLVFIILSKFHS